MKRTRLPFFRSTTQQIVAAATLLVLSFVAQTASLLHAEVHAFHTSSELCGVFHGVEKQPSLLTQGCTGLQLEAPDEQPPVLFASQFIKPAARVFQARAPPLFRFQTLS